MSYIDQNKSKAELNYLNVIVKKKKSYLLKNIIPQCAIKVILMNVNNTGSLRSLFKENKLTQNLHQNLTNIPNF